MFKISRKYEFAAAHRLEGHPKCGRLHGHNYTVIVELMSADIEDGMIMDYGDMDVIIKPFIDSFDHRYMVSRENRDCADPYAEIALRSGDAVDVPTDRSTAEELSKYMFYVISETLLSQYPQIILSSVTVIEAPKSSATFSR